MPATNRCPQCGSELPDEMLDGLCPKCVARFSLEPADDPPPLSGPFGTVIADSPPAVQPSRLRYFGDYELLEEIARGGMGVVYKARQVTLNRIVAVKMILAGQLARPEDVQRFRAEAEAAANLKHPNIVAIHEVGEHEGQHYFSMDFIEGQSLAELVRDGPLPAQRAARYAQIIAGAIHYAHQHGTLHRDLKPSNVLVDATDQPQVTDFGLAKQLKSDLGLTATGQVLGSPNYLPPEQAVGNQTEAGAPSDVYGVGAILYELLTGRPPFFAGTVHETLMQVIQAEPVAPRLLNAGVPRDLETICLKCLEKNPLRRYRATQELADELGRFIRNEPIHARPAGPWERMMKWARRRPSVAALLAVMFLVGAGGISGIFWQWRTAEAARGGLAEKAAAAERAQEAEAKESYAANLALAAAKIEKRELNRARDMLDRCPPQLRHWEWGWLRQLCMTGPKILEGHVGPVADLAFTPDGERLVTAGDMAARIWDVEQGRHLATLGTTPTSGYNDVFLK